jgi:hypothetical protein
MDEAACNYCSDRVTTGGYMYSILENMLPLGGDEHRQDRLDVTYGNRKGKKNKILKEKITKRGKNKVHILK